MHGSENVNIIYLFIYQASK